MPSGARHFRSGRGFRVMLQRCDRRRPWLLCPHNEIDAGICQFGSHDRSAGLDCVQDFASVQLRCFLNEVCGFPQIGIEVLQDDDAALE